MSKTHKPICIMDTDSLLFSFKLDCPPGRAIEQIDKHFDLFFPNKVLEESRNVFKDKEKGYDDLKSHIELFLKKKRNNNKVIDECLYSNCLELIRRWFNLTGKQDKYLALDDGEKHCVALGLYLSRIRKESLLVITDDFRAINAGFDIFIDNQRVGLINSLLGTMVFIYFVNREITRSRILGIINDYFTINKPEHIDIKQFKEKLRNEIELSCRLLNFNTCQLSCLHGGCNS